MVLQLGWKQGYIYRNIHPRAEQVITQLPELESSAWYPGLVHATLKTYYIPAVPGNQAGVYVIFAGAAHYPARGDLLIAVGERMVVRRHNGNTSSLVR